MSKFSEQAGNVIKIGVIATVFFMAFFLIEEWGIWYVPTINMVIFGMIAMLLGLIGKLCAAIERLEESINNQGERSEP